MDFQHILEDMFQNLNEIRLHPQAVAQQVTRLRPAYNGNVFNNRIKTREGVRALENLITDLNNRQPNYQRLKWSFALHLAADQQATILGEQGLVTTENTGFYRPLPDRVQQHAIIRGRITQIYEFGGRTAHEILQELLIDDGLASRKRRNTLLDPIYRYVGIGCSYHEKLEACTVIILAEDIVSLVAPGQAGKFRRRRGVQQGKQYIFNINNQILLNAPNLINQGQNQGLQNALLNDMKQYDQQNKQHLRGPLLNDLNDFQRNNKQHLREGVMNDMHNYQGQHNQTADYHEPRGRVTYDEPRNQQYRKTGPVHEDEYENNNNIHVNQNPIKNDPHNPKQQEHKNKCAIM